MGEAAGLGHKVKEEGEEDCPVNLPWRLGRIMDPETVHDPWPGRLGKARSDESVTASNEDGMRRQDFPSR